MKAGARSSRGRGQVQAGEGSRFDNQLMGNRVKARKEQARG